MGLNPGCSPPLQATHSPSHDLRKNRGGALRPAAGRGGSGLVAPSAVASAVYLTPGLLQGVQATIDLVRVGRRAGTESPFRVTCMVKCEPNSDSGGGLGSRGALGASRRPLGSRLRGRGRGEGFQARRQGWCRRLPWFSGLCCVRDLASACHVSASPWQQKHSPKQGLWFPRRGLSHSPLPSPAGKGNAHSRAFRELVKLHRISSGRKPRVYFKRFQHPRQLWL